MTALQLIATPPRGRYSAERTLALPAFWAGVVAARVELYRADPSLVTGRGLVRAQLIARKRMSGVPLAAIAEFGDWLGSGSRP